MALQFTTSYVEDSIHLFRYYKKLADSAVAQVTHEQLYALLDEDANSIAIVMKHMAGNMKSRWTEFLTSDRGKPWRAAPVADPSRHRVHRPAGGEELSALPVQIEKPIASCHRARVVRSV